MTQPPRICLDWHGGTPVLPEVLAAMQPWFTEEFASPSALHGGGLRATAALNHAREQAAALLGEGSPDSILFTSGGTESVNLAIKGAAFANQRFGQHIITTEIEHPAVLKSIDYLETLGFTSTRVKTDGLGRIDPAAIRAVLRDDTILVATHHANHELGTIQPVAELAKITRERGIPLMLDATVSGGWLPLPVETLGADLVALAPHRFHGPKGVGILYHHHSARLQPILHGGVQEGQMRAGTENVPGIVGAGVACALAKENLSSRIAHVAELQRAFWAGLQAMEPAAQLHGPLPGPDRLATQLNFSLSGVDGEGVVLASDLRGFALSSGPVCVTTSRKYSYVLQALGVAPEIARGNLLVSFGLANTHDDITTALSVLRDVLERLRGL